jgi:hypothetical protein
MPTNQSGTTSSIVAGQIMIATTGTAVQLPSNPALINGITIYSSSGNNASGGTVGGSNVTNTVDGTGNGAILYASGKLDVHCSNSNKIWINGTSGDIFSFTGN